MTNMWGERRESFYLHSQSRNPLIILVKTL